MIEKIVLNTNHGNKNYKLAWKYTTGDLIQYCLIGLAVTLYPQYFLNRDAGHWKADILVVLHKIYKDLSLFKVCPALIYICLHHIVFN